MRVRRLLEVLIAAAELFADERRQVERLRGSVLKWAVLACALALLLVGGLGFLLAAAYLALAPGLGPAIAALLTGGGALVVGVVWFLLVKGPSA